MCVSEASCPNFEPRAHARLTGLIIHNQATRRRLPDVVRPAAAPHFQCNVVECENGPAAACQTLPGPPSECRAQRGPLGVLPKVAT